jgi:hypothetical protein
MILTGGKFCGPNYFTKRRRQLLTSSGDDKAHITKLQLIPYYLNNKRTGCENVWRILPLAKM